MPHYLLAKYNLLRFDHSMMSGNQHLKILSRKNSLNYEGSLSVHSGSRLRKMSCGFRRDKEQQEAK